MIADVAAEGDAKAAGVAAAGAAATGVAAAEGGGPPTGTEVIGPTAVGRVESCG